jgi:molybdate transport system substrate-binding protein
VSRACGKRRRALPWANLIARGEADLGFQQLSELIHLDAIQVLGPLTARDPGDDDFRRRRVLGFRASR